MNSIETSPLVSICIPVYNSRNTIQETLNSLLVQSYSNFEIIISDNASTDDTLEVVSNFKDSRIKVHRNEINIVEENFNRCIQLATGKYTAIFHADDFYEPNMIETQLKFLEINSQAGAVFTQAILIDEMGVKIGKTNVPIILNSPCYLYDFETIFKAVLQYSNFLVCPSAMVRTKIYQEEMKCWRWKKFGSSADLDMWFRISRIHNIGILPMPLMRYRISNSQWSAKVRLQTERADFFGVVDHYIKKDNVSGLLNFFDTENYLRLERRDTVMRAINLFILGDAVGSRNLLSGFNLFGALSAALKTKRGFGVLIAWGYLQVLFLLRLNKFGQVTLSFLKSMMRK